MRPVFFTVAGVHHQQVLVFDEAVKIGVIEHASGFVGNHGVLTEPDIQRGRIIGQDMLEKWQRLRPADHEAAHVRHVEQAGGLARGQVFLDDAGRIVQGLVPAAEFHELGAVLQVTFVENRLQQICHFSLPLCFLFCFAPPCRTG